MERIYAVIPAYNAAMTLRRIVKRLKSSIPSATIIVVNDGSIDATEKTIAGIDDIIYLKHDHNLGKGTTLRSGFKKALAEGATLILTLDADGQHDPADAEGLLDELYRQNADVMIGSRMTHTERMPLPRVMSNKITSKLISWRLGAKIEDSQSGFRLYRSRVFEALPLHGKFFDLETELLIKIGQRGSRIGTATIETIYQKDQPSAMRIIDIFRFVKVYMHSFFWRI
ncbi:MAG: glycosyltransferase family 2 protein [bacterium]